MAYGSAQFDAIFTDDRYNATIVRSVVRRWFAKQDTLSIAQATGFAESLVSDVIARFQDRRHAVRTAQDVAVQA